MEKRYLSLKEAAKYIGISEKTLYNRIAPKATSPLPVRVKRVGRRVIFDIKNVDEYMAS